MILFASVESERATKAQGGNKFLNINLFGGSAKRSELLGSLHLLVRDFVDLDTGLEYNGGTEVELTVINKDSNVVYRDQIKLNIKKGEKLKTAKIKCRWCDKNTLDEYNFCTNCLQTQ